jgi:excisionase family DNA binding protein
MARRVISIPPVEHRITTEQVQDRLKCSRRNVYRLAAEGRITVFKSGATNIYDAREVDALIVRRSA